MTPSSQLFVVMVEDNLDLSLTVEDFLSAEPRLKVLGAARDENGFKQLIHLHLPDLALIDIGLDTPRSGLGLLAWLRREFPIIKPVIMTVNQGDVLEAYNLGARGYVLKSNLEILAPTLLEVSAGKLIIPPNVSELFLSQVTEAAANWKISMELERFSVREKEILNHLRLGIRREDIADKCGISFFTVRRHIQNMLEKTGEPSVKAILDRFGEVLGA
ncbi:MAG: response regulator transcription factor [Fibrobacteria bacterium]